MIGKRIKARREELGLTQEELAKKLGYKSKSSINKIEVGKNDITQSRLLQFAEALNCPPTYFIEVETVSTPSSERVFEYAKRLASLSPQQQENALQYIDFLSHTDKTS